MQVTLSTIACDLSASFRLSITAVSPPQMPSTAPSSFLFLKVFRISAKIYEFYRLNEIEMKAYHWLFL